MAIFNPWTTSKAYLHFNPGECFQSPSSSPVSTYKAHLQSFGSLPKPIFALLRTSNCCLQLKGYFQSPPSMLGGISKAHLHPFKYFQRLASSLGVLPKPIFNHWKYYQSSFSTPVSTLNAYL